jgi:outer membrane protein assembly factor BamB
VASSPTVAEGLVYVGSDDGSLWALDAVTGQVWWVNFEVAREGSSPVVRDGTVFVGSDDAFGYNESLYPHLFAFDAQTGEALWWTPVMNEGYGGFPSSPTVAGDLVYVATDDGSLWALEAATGELWWVTFGVAHEGSSPVVKDGTVYVGSDDAIGYDLSPDPHLFALDRQTGEVLWWTPLVGDGYGGLPSTPTVAGDLVYVATDDGSLWALEAASGQVVWVTIGVTGEGFSPVVKGRTVFVGSDASGLCALDRKTGAEVWCTDVFGVDSSPALGQGLIFVGSDEGGLVALTG